MGNCASVQTSWDMQADNRAESRVDVSGKVVMCHQCYRCAGCLDIAPISCNTQQPQLTDGLPERAANVQHALHHELMACCCNTQHKLP